MRVPDALVVGDHHVGEIGGLADDLGDRLDGGGRVLVVERVEDDGESGDGLGDRLHAVLVGLAERVLLERPGGDAGGEGHQEHDQRLQREQLHTERHLRGHGSILPGGWTGREPPAEVFTTNSYGTRPMVSEA